MHLPFYIAKRYFFAKKSHNIINIISGISVAGITVGTMALVVVLSVFNGFQQLVESLFNTFNPDLVITWKEGKTFNASSIPAEKLKKLSGVIKYTEVIEENALLRYHEKQFIATIKGVSSGFKKANPLDTMLVEGDFVLEDGETDYAVMGAGIAYYLNVQLNDFNTPLMVYVPRRGSNVSLNLEEAFNSEAIYLSGIFSVQQDFDTKYLLVPIRFARRLLDYDQELTSIELSLSDKISQDKIQKQAETLCGKDFVVKNRFQQQEMLYRIMKSEKWAIFLILAFILFIAAFNVVGSLSMLILDKTEDIGILRNMGADNRLIKNIFRTEGLLISIGGALLGLFFGFIVCYLQQQFGIIRLQSADSTFVVNAYPVKMQWMDFLSVFATVLALGIVAAWFPVRRLGEKQLRNFTSKN
ncbi:MAG: FtsX-like permease family protein [Lentimicrobiaceae bacterium]|nr:FtsX-like permease family protein [Lentimicrobiaceae bacterium]